MAELRGASERAYFQITKDGENWPAVKCKPPMKVPSEIKAPGPFHVCFYIPELDEFRWMIESDLAAFDNGEMNKFTQADDPKRWEAFVTVVQRIVDEPEPDYGFWASEILAHRLHDELDDEEEEVKYDSDDSDVQIIEVRPVRAPSSLASDSKKPGHSQGLMTDQAKVKKTNSANWLSKMNQMATQNLEQEEKKKKRKRATYIPDEIDDKPKPRRKKTAKSTKAKSSKAKPSPFAQEFFQNVSDDDEYDLGLVIKKEETEEKPFKSKERTPETDNGTSETENGTLTTKNGTFTTDDGASKTGEGSSNTDDGKPKADEGTSKHEDGAPKTAGGTSED